MSDDRYTKGALIWAPLAGKQKRKTKMQHIKEGFHYDQLGLEYRQEQSCRQVELEVIDCPM